MSFISKIKQYKTALIVAPFFYRLTVLFMAGATLSFIQAPYHLWPLLFLSFGLFYFLYAQVQTKMQAFLTGFVFALGYFVLGLSWIGNALLVEGNEYRWAWPLAVIALPALLSFFTALYTTISYIVFRKHQLSGLIGFCVCIALSEWVRGHVFTGFPWNLYGYGWISVLPIAQSVSFIGPYGLTFLTIFWGAVAGFYALNPSAHKAPIIVAALTFVTLYGVGIVRMSEPVRYHEGLNIHLVQANIEQKDKWNPEKLVDNFQAHIDLSMMRSDDLNSKNMIVWPETSLPPSFLNSPAVRERIQSILGKDDILLAGALEITSDLETKKSLYHNSLTLWTNQIKDFERVYSKRHLVPFGEYIPFQGYIPLKTVTQFSGFQRGGNDEAVEIKGFPPFLPLICYEIIFPEVKNITQKEFILTVTNDGWYGMSAGPYQHFTQARFRAIEQGVPVVRSANTGVSGVIDPYGRVVQKSSLGSLSVITSQLPMNISAKTLYSMHGNLVFFSIISLMLFLAIILKIKDF